MKYFNYLTVLLAVYSHGLSSNLPKMRAFSIDESKLQSADPQEYFLQEQDQTFQSLYPTLAEKQQKSPDTSKPTGQGGIKSNLDPNSKDYTPSNNQQKNLDYKESAPRPDDIHFFNDSTNTTYPPIIPNTSCTIQCPCCMWVFNVNLYLSREQFDATQAFFYKNRFLNQQPTSQTLYSNPSQNTYPPAFSTPHRMNFSYPQQNNYIHPVMRSTFFNQQPTSQTLYTNPPQNTYPHTFSTPQIMNSSYPNTNNFCNEFSYPPMYIDSQNSVFQEYPVDLRRYQNEYPTNNEHQMQSRKTAPQREKHHYGR